MIEVLECPNKPLQLFQRHRQKVFKQELHSHRDNDITSDKCP